MNRFKQRGIIEALLPIGAAIIGGLFGKSNQENTNETNVQLGREQMAFQERMSNSAYQRGVSDMQKAGLNPMLAYSQGGASAPMGSMPQVQNSVSAGMNSAASSMQIMQGLQQVLKTKADTDNVKASTDKTRSETYDIDVNTAFRNAELRKLEEEEGSVRAHRRKTDAEVIGSAAESARKEKELEEMSRDGGAGFRADVRRRKAEASLTELEIPKSQAEAKFWEGLGQANPYLRQLLMLLRAGSSVRQIGR